MGFRFFFSGFFLGGFGVWGLGLRVFGFRAQTPAGLKYWVKGLGLRIFRVLVFLGFRGCRLEGSGFRNLGFRGFRV